MFYFVFFIFFFLSLFLLYVLSKNDFVLLRENVSVSHVFNIAFLILVPAFLLGRFLYALDTGKFAMLLSLAFLHIVRFPGISILGCFLGGSIGLALLEKKKEALLRLYDIFLLAFSPLFYFSILMHSYSGILFFVKLVELVVFPFFLILFLRYHRKYTLRDGSIFLIMTTFISLDNIVRQIAAHKVFFSLFSVTQVISIVLLVVAITAFLINQKVLVRRGK